MRLGHHGTLFASGDPLTRARFVACAPRALRLNAAVRDPVPHLLLMLERVRQRAHESDVRHFHIDPLLHLPLFRPLNRKTPSSRCRVGSARSTTNSRGSTHEGDAAVEVLL